MAQLSGNTCDVITLLPLGVICNTTNASTPTTTNGSIYLQITGGSSPYNVTWSNGGQGQSLINLKAGDYTATVVDYYGDYSATTTCTVGFESFDLDWFEDCSTPGSYLYYTSQEPSIFTSGLVYELNGRDGCWTSSGTTLWTGQTYTDSFASIKGGPFDDCTTCLPEPTPIPVYPQYICLSANFSPYTQYTFESGSTIYNGYPVWEETGSTGYKMVYFTNGGYWTMSGWTGFGILQSLPKSGPPPTGLWLVLGSENRWTASSGLCTSTPIVVTLQKSNPSCSQTSDGQIVVSASGGVPGYTYSLDGSVYQNSSTFNGLSDGSGTVYVKDSNGTIKTENYTLTNQNPVRSYQASIGSSSETLVTKTLTSELKKKTFTTVLGNGFTDIPVNPDVVTYQVAINYNIELYGTYNGSTNVPSFTTGVTVNATGGYSVTSSSQAAYNNTVSTVTSGNRTQPKSAITFNMLYQIEYDPQNTSVGETLTFEVLNGGTVYPGGAEDLFQQVKSKIGYVSVTKCKLTNINACSSASCFQQSNNHLEIDI